MTLTIGAEIILDGALLFLASFVIFGEYTRMRLRDGLLALCFALFCAVSRISVEDGGEAARFLVEKQGYDIVPANGLAMFLFLILAVLVANSLWFRKSAVYTIFGTLAVFSAVIVTREIFILLFYGLGTNAGAWKPLGCRACSVILLFITLFSPFWRWLKEKLDDDSMPIKLLIGNTTVLLGALVVFLGFDATKTADNLPVIAGAIIALFAINFIVGIYAQKHSAEKKRINLLEQYIPVIEELITQVRARQHEFNNRLLAISAAAQTAITLEQAKTDIAELTAGLQMNISEKSLLNCDSKITAGMIYSKIKYAEMRKIAVVSEITASLKSRTIREADIVEIVGILMDNAIEASNAGDTVYIKIETLDEKLSLVVSNPYEMLTATDFVRMFRRGFSTKTGSDARGHGLANIKEIVERQHGKILTRNETVHGRNYVTIGVLFS
jgi:signal transduction histidine kinase